MDCVRSPALLLATALVFLPALSLGSVRWDDDLLVFENPAVRALAAGDAGVHAALWSLRSKRESFGAQYQPLSDLSYALDGALFGFEDARPFHAQGVLWHLAAVAALFSLARALGLSSGGAALAAGLFALHPAQVESVVWIAGRRTAISGALALLCARVWVAYRSGPMALGARQGALLLATLALAAASDLAKQGGLAIPVVLLGIEALLGPGAATHEGERCERRWLALLAQAALAAGFAMLFAIVGRREGVIREHAPPLGERAAGALEAIAAYARIVLAPADLHASYIHATPSAATVSLAALLGGAIALAALGGAALLGWRALRRGERLSGIAALGVVGAGACLAPALTGLGTQWVAERYLYLTLALLGLAAGAGWDALGPRRWRAPLALAAGALLALSTLAQTQVWRDDVALWERGVASEPQSRIAQRMLGRAYLRRLEGDDAASAEAHLRAAAMLEQVAPSGVGPSPLPWILADLASLAERRGDPAEAERLLVQAAVAVAPGSERAAVNLGDFYLRRGELAKARAVYAACAEGDPGAAVARERLGKIEAAAAPR